MSDQDSLLATYQKAQSYLYKGDIGAAIKLFSEAAEGYLEALEPIMAASAFISAGGAYLYSSDFESPILAFRKAQKLLIRQDEPVVTAHLLRSRAKIHAVNGKLLLAYEDLCHSEEQVIRVENGVVSILDTDQLVATYTAKAQFFRISGEWKEVQIYLDKAFEMIDTVTQQHRFDLLVETARYYLLQSDYVRLERVVSQIEEQMHKLGSKDDRPIAWAEYLALKAHNIRYNGEIAEVRTIAKQYVELLQQFSRVVREKLEVATQGTELTQLVSRFP